MEWAGVGRPVLWCRSPPPRCLMAAHPTGRPATGEGRAGEGMVAYRWPWRPPVSHGLPSMCSAVRAAGFPVGKVGCSLTVRCPPGGGADGATPLFLCGRPQQADTLGDVSGGLRAAEQQPAGVRCAVWPATGHRLLGGTAPHSTAYCLLADELE